MKKINKTLIALGIFIIALFLYGNISLGAHSTSSKWLGLYNKGNGRPTGFYTSGTTTGVKSSIPVIKIVEYTSSAGTVQKGIQQAVYCIKDGVGFGSPGSSGEVVNYTEYFDLKDPDNTSNPITGNYRTALPSGSNYNKLLWLLDNIALTDSTESINELLNKAGLSKADFTTDRTGSNNSMTDAEFIDIIEVIQQAAIWYFTNAGDDFQPSINSVFHVAVTNGGTGVSLGSKYNLDLVDDPVRILYRYLVDEANRNGSYTPVSDSADAITFDKNRATVSFENGKILVGPYRVTGNLSSYNLDAKILNGTTEITNPTLLASNKSTVLSGSNTTAKIKSNLNQDFYISLPADTNITRIGINLTTSYKTTRMTYWSAPSAQGSQPVVIIDRGNVSKEYNDAKTITKPTFDVSLRKYITALNGTNLSSDKTREPSVDVSPLKASSTTATYKHTKEPVKVSENDIITYTIRVYNEGEIDGYVDEIVDHLPPELEFLPDDSINKQYKWQIDSSDTTGRTIKTTYLSKENGASANLIAKFNKSGNALDSKYIQIRCKVKEGAETDKLITNIAEITRSSNEFGYADRDNRNRVTMPTDSNLPSYKGKDSNKSDLNDKNYYYEGQEDDDDFEKIIVEKEEYFDLALRKFITYVGDTIHEMTDIFHTIDGVNARKYDREPVITKENLEALKNGTGDLFDGTTTRKEHTKVPLTVNTGDKVHYIIRIYNEGNVDGYADEITDYLPEGLELIPESQSTTNSKYGWTADSTGRIIKTNYLSKTRDAENNLIKAFTGEGRIWYKDVEVECRVVATPTQEEKRLKNVAEITASSNAKNLADRDSIPNNLTDTQKNNYNPGTSEAGKGYQDDDDYEDLRLAGTYFDVSLRKFITGINNTELKTNNKYNREPIVDVTPLKNGNTTATYKHTKEPVKVSENDTITYTIRVYNEGEVSGYVDEITDHLPPELEFLPNDELNKQYGWTVDSTGRTVKTAFLSKAYQESEKAKGNNVDNLLKGFDTTKDALDYRDVQIKCKVKAKVDTKKYFTNIAEVTARSNSYNIVDRDNTVNVNMPADSNLPSYKGKQTNKDNLNDSNYYYEGQEDDDDFEKVFVEKFDLALRKFIISVNGTNLRAEDTTTSDGINRRIYSREPAITRGKS